jgi:hypothetical protein
MDEFREGLVRVGTYDGYDFIDKQGKEVIPIIFDKVNSFSEGLAEVKFIDKLFYINREGNYVKDKNL